MQLQSEKIKHPKPGVYAKWQYSGRALSRADGHQESTEVSNFPSVT